MAKPARRRARNKTAGPTQVTSSSQVAEYTEENTGFDWIYFGVLACFVLSGFAALLYQTAWLRQFSIVFGTSELAVATVLAAYMAGLALGASIAARYVQRVIRPVLVYGLLEAGIALSALAVPWMLLTAGSFYSSMLGGQPLPPDSASTGQLLFYLLAGFVILALPTTLMGATLPLLIRHVVQDDTQLGSRVATLYAYNTLGAVLGTLTAAFLLLPTLGLDATVWCGVAINFIVFLLALALAKRLPSLESLKTDETANASQQDLFQSCVKPWSSSSGTSNEKTGSVFCQQPLWILPLMLLSGCNAFYYEVLWTRLINHVLGGSIYAFATMLASFLSGIAIGGAIAGRFARTREQAASTFAFAQLAIGICSVAIYSWMEHAIPQTRELSSDVFFSALVMLPSTIFIGATLPLAVRILARNEDDAGSGTARVYSWNTVGAILGAILAGFYLIPLLGFEGSIRLTFITNLLLSLCTLVTIAPRQPVYIGILIFTTVAALVFYHPARPQTILNASRFNGDKQQGESKELYFAVGRSATVLMSANDGWINLRTNGLAEALIDAKGAPAILQNQRWLTALPVAARPGARSILVVGFGGGMALEGFPHTVEDVDVIELEAEVIEANRAISSIRARDPLADPRVNVIINDARNALGLTSKNYDIIVSQPSHPWTAGASHLYTREFIALSKQHLVRDGVFVQWMNTEFVDQVLLRSLAATLLDVFDNVRVYQPQPGALFFLASDADINIERQIARGAGPLGPHADHYALLGLNSLEDFIASLALDEKGLREFASGATISTDNFNLMATRSRSRGDGLTAAELFELFSPFDPLLKNDSWINRQLQDDIDPAYIGSRLLRIGFAQRANKLAEITRDRATGLFLRAAFLAHLGRRDEAHQYLRAAIHERPSYRQASFAMLKNRLASLVSNNASDELQVVARNLQGSPKAVIEGWGYAATKNWLKLVELEEQLAQSTPTDTWYPEAMQLRVEWRTKLKAEGLQRNLPMEALLMIDRTLLIAPGLDLYLLRAVCGLLLKDAHVYVESSRYVTKYIELKLEHAKNGDYLLSTSEQELMISRLEELSKKLNSDFIEPVRERALEAQVKMDKLVRELRNFKTAG